MFNRGIGLRSCPIARRPGAHRHRRGAAATELAILLPFLLLAFGVAIDFCRAYHASQTIQSSAHAGVLYASGYATADSATKVEDAVKAAAIAEATSLNPALTADKVTVAITATTATVTVTYDFPFLTPLVGQGGAVTMTRSATMNVAP